MVMAALGCLSVFERYFSRNAVGMALDFAPVPDAIVVVPVWNDRDIFDTVDSLYRCVLTAGRAGAVIVVNHGEQEAAELKKVHAALADELEEYVRAKFRANPAVQVRVGRAFDLPSRTAGVGLARKWGMDAAAAYFYRHGKGECPIVSLDADTRVAPNYFDELIGFFRREKVAGVSIAYEHRLEECEGRMREAMMKYELYLRYYEQALRYTGHPHAFHCIGSAFAVRASDYAAQGGMNKRQAGEDFYFLQKLIATGRFAELNATKVYPSARFSARTPFGTGQAVKRIADEGGCCPTYCWEAFEGLKVFFDGLLALYKAGEEAVRTCFEGQISVLRDYLYENEFVGIVQEVNANCASEKQFAKRFFDHFNAFRVLKFLNYAHGHFFARQDVLLGTLKLCRALHWPQPSSLPELLDLLRLRQQAGR